MDFLQQIGTANGLAFGDTFLIQGRSQVYTFTEEGVRSEDGTIDYSATVRLTRGKLVLAKPEFKPTQGNVYFCVSAMGDITGKNYHAANIYDRINLKIGNCFRTREEVTPEIVKKYTDFYASDERIDI